MCILKKIKCVLQEKVSFPKNIWHLNPKPFILLYIYFYLYIYCMYLLLHKHIDILSCVQNRKALLG